jgi:hypothetical protein
MAPITMTSSQQILAQAAQKLSAAVTDAGAAPNDFAKNLLELLEVSTKIDQFDEMAAAADKETTSDEAQKWREISLMTMQHARAHLVEHQRRLLEGLHGLSEGGASLYKAPDGPQSSEVKPAPTIVQPPPGLSPEVKSNQMAVKPPPGMTSTLAQSTPLKSSKVTDRKPQPPPGLKPPPGLASAGTASVTPPPGFNNPANRKPAGKKPLARKEATVHPWRLNKQGDDKVTSFFDARFGNETTEAANSGMINLDAYESD